jgi:hypothetical protein
MKFATENGLRKGTANKRFEADAQNQRAAQACRYRAKKSLAYLAG